MNIIDIDLEKEFPKLDRDALVAIADARDDQKWQVRNQVARKARDQAYQNVPGWAQRQNRAVNGILRAIRRTGVPFPTDRTMTLMAAAEDAVLVQLSLDGFLTKDEHDLLWGPVGRHIEAVLGTELAPVAYTSTVGRGVAEAKRNTRKKAQGALTADEKAAAAEMLGVTPEPPERALGDELDSLLSGDLDLDAGLDALLGAALEPAPSVPDIPDTATVSEAIAASLASQVADELDDLLNDVA